MDDQAVILREERAEVSIDTTCSPPVYFQSIFRSEELHTGPLPLYKVLWLDIEWDWLTVCMFACMCMVLAFSWFIQSLLE